MSFKKAFDNFYEETNSKYLITKTIMNEIGGQLSKTLKESARILYQDHGCPKELIEIITTISQINDETITPA